MQEDVELSSPASPGTGLPDMPDGSWPVMLPGWVWITGAGPGDPGLLTLHALNGLRQADVIVYDALVNPRILDWRRPDALMRYAGKRGGRPSPKQRDISLQLIELARAGRRVLRLKGGDPFVFGRGGEEALTLIEHGVPIRIIPGISAGIGGLAYAGIPVTHRDVNQAVTFLTGHDQSGLTPSTIDWQAVAKASPVIVLYMATRYIAEIAAALIAAGRSRDEPVAVVADATLPSMRIVETTLVNAADDIAVSGIKPPTIICIGKVVLMRKTLDWISSELRAATPRDHPDIDGNR